MRTTRPSRIDNIKHECSVWFSQRGLTAAVVGYSGGVDSATTIALLKASRIPVHIVVAEGPNQKYSSPYGGRAGAEKVFSNLPDFFLHHVEYPHLFDQTSANEAAAPIHRVAIFYGVCAALKTQRKLPVVVGTANFDEAAYLGFWGKSSDAAQDFYPISHLHKSEVKELAKDLGLPRDLIEAIPSGDLFFEETNDEKMIGASYDQIEKIATAAEQAADLSTLKELIQSVHSPTKFCRQILSNSFKYDLPFSGFHLSGRLELFRHSFYDAISKAATEVLRP